jgi:hypothetical protein
MHFAFVPVVKDKKKGDCKVSAHESVDRKDLKTFHDDLSRRMEQVFGRDIGILNEATKEGNKNIDELKSESRREAAEILQKAQEEASIIIDTAKKTSERIISESTQRVKIVDLQLTETADSMEALKLKKNALVDRITELVDMRDVCIDIDSISPKKALFGDAIKDISIEDIEKLKKSAKIGCLFKAELQTLRVNVVKNLLKNPESTSEKVIEDAESIGIPKKLIEQTIREHRDSQRGNFSLADVKIVSKERANEKRMKNELNLLCPQTKEKLDPKMR